MWWVDDLGATLRKTTAQLAIPLPALRGQDVCLDIDAMLFDRLDSKRHNHRLFLSLGDQEFGFQMSTQTRLVKFRLKVPGEAWKGAYFFLNVSQYSKDMSYLEAMTTWWKSRRATIGLQSMFARRCSETN